jgi:hypothetical protein
MQSIAIDYRRLQAEQLQANLHTNQVKLKTKVQGGLAYDQQSGHLHHALCKHCHLQ